MFRIVPTLVSGYRGFLIQKSWWFGWRVVGYADDEAQATMRIEHMQQEPKYYGANG